MNATTSGNAVPFPIDREDGDDPRVLGLVKEYQAEWDAGRRPDRAAFLARHPELAAALGVYFDGIDFMHRGAKALSGTGPGPGIETGLARGDRLGEFELIREIGRGGMGVVYEARQASLNRRVAVKVLPAAFAADRARLQRFTVEAQAAAAVAHPHIVTVYAIGEDRGIHFYAMRLVDGVALDALAAEASTSMPRPLDETQSFVSTAARSRWNGPAIYKANPASAPLVALAQSDRQQYHREVVRLGSQVARALDHAHQCGVVHRDIKPANLLLDRDGHVWVTDFGLAQLAEGPAVTRTGGAVGTLRYMSPEQAGGDRRRLDHRTDVYSLAATIYELAAGRPAFPAEEPGVLLHQIMHVDPTPPSQVDPDFPIDLETVLLKALQKEPRDRYATAGELADDLDRFLAGQPVQARRPSPWDRIKRWAGRHPASLAAALGSLVVVALASGIAAAVVANEQRETARAYGDSQKAHAETQRARLDADALAKAERHRADEAEKRFRRAKQLGDLVLQITEEEMGADRPFQGPRRRLLLAALDNYRGLLAGGHDDPLVRAELDRVTARVQTLLAEQNLRWEADGAFLLRNTDVRTELALTADQARQVDRLYQPGPSSKGPDRRRHDPGTEAKIGLIKKLTKEQRQRLRQISIQFRGPMVFNEPEVVEALNLSYPQRLQIRAIQTEELGGFGPFGFGGPPGKGPRQPPGFDVGAKAKAMERILDSLAPDQRDAWTALCGKPFAPR